MSQLSAQVPEWASATTRYGFKLAASNIGWKNEDDAYILRKMRALGFHGLEIAPTRIFPRDPYAYRSSATLFAIAMNQEYHLAIPSMQSIWFGEEGNLFDPDDVEHLMAHTRCAFRFAHAMHCPSMVFGCPRGRNVPKGHDAREADAFFLRAAEYGEEYGVKLAMEANPPMYNTNFLNTHKETFEFVRRLGAPALSVNLDLGAMLANGETVADVAPDFALVSHVHISEPGLAPIERREIHTELAKALQAAGYTGYVSMEMKAADCEIVEGCLGYLAEVFL